MRKFLNLKFLALPVALAAAFTLSAFRPASALDLDDFFAPAINPYPAVVAPDADDFYVNTYPAIVAPDQFNVNTYPAIVAPDTDFDLW